MHLAGLLYLHTMKILPTLLSCDGITVKYVGSRILVGSQSRQLTIGMWLAFHFQLSLLFTHQVMLNFVFFSKTD